MNKKIHSDSAPRAIGPYSQAVLAASTLYCSGQIALDPGSGELVEGGIEAQTKQVLKNLQSVVEAAGFALSDVVKTTIFLSDLGDFAKVNEIYGAAFSSEPKPARSTVQVAKLPRGALVEIEATAVLH